MSKAAGSRELDVEVATRITGYRWVEWNHDALDGAPIDEPGRFLAHPDEPTYHLCSPAPPGTPDAQHPFRFVPPYSTNLDSALDAAEHVGLFRSGNAILTEAPGGRWLLEIGATGERFEGSEAASVVCRAVLAWHEHAAADGAE